MNILHLTTHLDSDSVSNYLLSLLPAEKRMGHHVALWGHRGDCLKKFQEIADEVFETAPRTKSELSPRLWLALPGLLSVLKEQSIDLMHAHTRATRVLAAAGSKITGIPYVSTVHSICKAQFLEKLFPCWGRAIFAVPEAVRGGLIDAFGISALPIIEVIPASPEHQAEGTLKIYEEVLKVRHEA